jgi:hypothetical protein
MAATACCDGPWIWLPSVVSFSLVYNTGGYDAVETLPPGTYVNIMDQYRPCGDIIPPGSPLSRRITPAEFRRAIAIAREEGMTRFDAS